MNPIVLEKVNDWLGSCLKAVEARNGTSGEHTQMLLNSVNLAGEFAGIGASALVSIAYDVRAILAEVRRPTPHRLTGLSNKSEGLK